MDRKFFSAISEVEAKNRGGCLFFCYAAWKWVRLQSQNPFNIYQISDNSMQLYGNLGWIQKGDGAPQSARHFFWEFGGEKWDSNGKFSKEGSLLPLKEDQIATFCVLALNGGEWNTEFDRCDGYRALKGLGLDFPELNGYLKGII